MKNIEKITAIRLLEQREKGWSIIYAIKIMKMRFVSYMCIISIAIFLKSLSPPFLATWFLIVAGIMVGAFLRDIGWLIRLKKNWPFTEKITDWNKVKAIAEGKQIKIVKV